MATVGNGDRMLASVIAVPDKVCDFVADGSTGTVICAVGDLREGLFCWLDGKSFKELACLRKKRSSSTLISNRPFDSTLPK